VVRVLAAARALDLVLVVEDNFNNIFIWQRFVQLLIVIFFIIQLYGFIIQLYGVVVMSIVSKFRTIYLAVPLMLGLSACAPSKTFVFVNGPRDLEYRLGDHSKAMTMNVNTGIDNVHRHDFEMRFIPYQSLDKHDNIMYGMSRMNRMRPMDTTHYMQGMNGMQRMNRMNSDTAHYMRGINGRRMNGMQMNNMQNRMNNVSREDMMKYRNLMNEYKDMPEVIGEMMPMSKVNAIRNMELQGMRGMRPMDRMHNMYRGNMSDSSLFRPYMRSDTVRQMYRMQHENLMQKNMMQKK
jgi:hypothetical protein